MSWKDLIFTKEGEDSEKNNKVGTKTFEGKFPVSSVIEKGNPFPSKSNANFNTTSSKVTPDTLSCEPHMEKIMGMYEKGFEDLNQVGYDFYEFYKAIVEAGVNNPAMYQMAFTMAKSMDATVSKTSLLKQAEFYNTEITKVHSHYQLQGEAKESEITTLKTSEESALTSELTNIEAEIQRLNMLRTTTKDKLSTIDSKYTPEITEIKCKLMANNLAKDSILDSIKKVTTEINKNL